MVSLTESTRLERVLLLHREFISNRELRTQEMAERFGVTSRTIQYDLSAMAHILPIYYDNSRWVWVYEETAVSISLY